MATSINLVEAPLADLQHALITFSITSVELVSRYLLRIATYDTRGPSLNAIVILNPDVFREAAASDIRRLSGRTLGPLDGIPYTVKDSYKVHGLTVASGSSAFKDLVASEDAFTVSQLRKSGAVLIGKTNMPPMAAGGMQRGVYGRAESPYNLEYLTAGYASGSSNGSATATAASLCAFGMAEETVSSGRSPASNNGLVAYTPSRGLVSIRGNWPLYPTCDVIVPHTRTVDDLLTLLDVLVVEDEITEGDFWRSQSFIPLPFPSSIRPTSFLSLKDNTSLSGKKIGVPKMYIGLTDSSPFARPVHTRPSVLTLWESARATLESLGAEVIEVDFPLITNYESHDSSKFMNIPGLPDDWAAHERSTLLSYAWADFVAVNADPNMLSATDIDASKIFPRSIEEVQWKYSELANLIGYDNIFDALKDRPSAAKLTDIPGCEQALHALENARKRDMEDWMLSLGLDFVVFPANGDAGHADADINDSSAKHAWLNGVKYSNGNRAIRHLGIPTVTVPMGVMADIGMPVGLTFASKAYDDNNLLRWASAFEGAAKARRAPGLTPRLETDEILLLSAGGRKVEGGDCAEPPVLTLKAEKSPSSPNKLVIRVSGTAHSPSPSPALSLDLHVDGHIAKDIPIDEAGNWAFETEVNAPKEVPAHVKTEATVPRELVLVVALVRGAGRSVGSWALV